MDADWIEPAREHLVRLRGDGPGWGYAPGSESYVEPSVLASLALLSQESGEQDHATAAEVAGWLASIQRDDGALGLSASLREPAWPTTFACLLWQALGSHPGARAAALQFLAQRRGQPASTRDMPYVGYDATLPGWPWVEGTFSWVEPTSLAVLVLRRAALAKERTAEGLALLLDRAIPGGGWNYGNNVLFETTLRARPAPTGLALLALKAASVDDPSIESGLAELEATLPTVRSGQSLCWGLLGLSAWGRRPAEAGLWLNESAAAIDERPTPAPELAHLLLAAGTRSLERLGLPLDSSRPAER
jgi:hypothetical protein